MQELALRIAKKLSETLSEGRIGEPKWKECLAMMDTDIGLDASFLLLDRNHADDVQLVDTTTNKLSTFCGEQFPLEGDFLREVSERRVWGWFPLERNRYQNDALWELLWITMNLGAYAGPHKVCAIALPGRVDSDRIEQHETTGVLILFAPVTERTPKSSDWVECASLLAHIFSISSRCSTEQRLARDRLEHNQSEFYERVIAGGRDLNLHRIFHPLQGIELRAETLRREMIGGRPAAKHLDAIEAYVQDASANLRGFLYGSMKADTQPAGRQYQSGQGKSDVKKIVEALVKKFTPQVKLTSKTFVIRFQQEPAIFSMPEDAFQEVMGNLIHNAVKYSYTATKIKISYRQLVRGAAMDITSYGIAIKDEDREKIFSYGYRTPEAVQVEYAGVGMGLPAAREIALFHGVDLVLSANEPTTGVAHPRFGPQYRNTFTLRSHK